MRRWMPRSRRVHACAFTLAASASALTLLGAAPSAPPPPNQNPATPAAAATPEADRAAAHAAVIAFAKAFQTRDSMAMAEIWTPGGELRNTDGLTLRGRDAITQGFSTIFAGSPDLSAQIQPASLHFLSQDLATEQGIVTIRKNPADPPRKAAYSALLVREKGAWRLARLEESPAPKPTIQDLAWLIGEWRSSAGQNAQIATSYSWAPSKKFIHAAFSIKEKDLTLSGTQVIGVDPATGSLHTWSFEADGGIAEADWTPDGEHWVLDAAGTLADGRSLVETNILHKIDENSFTWQSIDRSLESESLPDLPPVKVTRVKPAN
jgi:uncharacterized protein (TIGR02246 family)